MKNLDSVVLLLIVVALVLVIIWVPREGYGPPLLTDCQHQNMELIVIIHLNTEAVERAYRVHVPDSQAPRRQGFTLHDPDSRKRWVHVPMLRGQQDQERLQTWGHELAHAVCGKWHPEVRE